MTDLYANSQTDSYADACVAERAAERDKTITLMLASFSVGMAAAGLMAVWVR